MRAFKWFIVLAIVVVTTAGLGSFFIQQINVPYGHGIRAEFEDLPADDKELEEWLTAQPGVINVHVSRRGNAIEVFWTIVQD